VCPNGIPDDVERFVVDCIHSVAELEALLLLRRRAPDTLDADAVGRELRIAPAWAAATLRELARRGLLSERARSAPVYGFAPRTPELERTVATLTQTYAERPVQIIGLIFGKPSANVRGLADAFRLRKD